MIPYYLDVLLERPLPQRILLIGAMVLLLAGLDYALVYRHQAGRIERVADELKLAGLAEARLRAGLARLPQLRQELAALQRELHSRLPRRSGASTPLEDISARAAMAGLEVVRFQPGVRRDEEHFAEIPVEVEFGGTFHELLRFFELSTGPHELVNVTELTIDALPAEDTLRIRMEIATLSVVSPGPVDEEAQALLSPAEPVDTTAQDGAGRTDTTRRRTLTPALASAGVGAEPPARDPFQPYRAPDPPKPDRQPAPDGPVSTDEPHPVQRFQAAGIVWESHAAVALVRDAEGFGHVVQPGARLGRHGYQVKTITPCAVVMETTGNHPDPHETRLKLPRCGAFEGGRHPRASPVFP